MARGSGPGDRRIAAAKPKARKKAPPVNLPPPGPARKLGACPWCGDLKKMKQRGLKQHMQQCVKRPSLFAKANQPAGHTPSPADKTNDFRQSVPPSPPPTPPAESINRNEPTFYTFSKHCRTPEPWIDFNDGMGLEVSDIPGQPDAEEPGVGLDEDIRGMQSTSEANTFRFCPPSEGNWISFVHHPTSQKAPDVFCGLSEPKQTEKTTTQSFGSAYDPFESASDAMVATFLVKHSLSEAAIEEFYKLLHNPDFDTAELAIKSAKGLRRSLKEVRSKMMEPMKEIEVSCKVNHRIYTAKFFRRNIEGVVRRLVARNDLAQHFSWYPRKRYRTVNGKTYREYDNPMEADDLWILQDRVDSAIPGAISFPCLLYSDKTKVARFSNTSCWPVQCWPLNLPESVKADRNLVGGTLIALLPIIDKLELPDGANLSPSHFSQIRKALYHACMEEILRPLERSFRYPFSMACGDGVTRDLCVTFPILSMDYEEAADACLILGSKTDCSCPSCLVPRSEISDLRLRSKSRSTAASQLRYQEAERLISIRKKEEARQLMREWGLRPMRNAFWCMAPLVDVYHSIGSDPLHQIDLGLCKGHFLPLLREVLEDVGGNGRAILDARLAASPPWPSMHRFSNGLSDLDFSDGNHYADALRIIGPLIPDIGIGEELNHAFARTARLLAEIRLLACRKVHNPETLAVGQEIVENFGISCNDLSEKLGTTSVTKSWQFPKMHSLAHLFTDRIPSKGSCRHSDSKIGEGEHRYLKIAYENSNKKDEAKQLIRTVEEQHVMRRISWQMQCCMGGANTLDRSNIGEAGLSWYAEPRYGRDAELVDLRKLHITFSGPQGSVTYKTIHADIVMFIYEEFGHRTYQPRASELRQLDDAHAFLATYVQVTYRSLETYEEISEKLRCKGNFHGRARHDGAFFDGTRGPIFGHVLALLQVKLADTPYRLVLFQPYSIMIRDSTGWLKLAALPKPALRPLSDLKRMAYIQPDPTDTNQMYLNDVIDPDWYERAKQL